MLSTCLLISFDNSKMEKLFDYILIDGKNSEDRKACFKFPGVAAELLSAPTQKISDFFAQEKDGSLPYVDRLMSCFCVINPPTVIVEQNLTRISYVHKVLNNLMSLKPALFMTYILSKPIFCDAIITNCHSKSIQTLLILMIMAQNPTAAQQSSDSLAGKENEQLKLAFFEKRAELFSNVLNSCLFTGNNDALFDAHINLCGVASTIFLREFLDRSKFLELFVNNFMKIFLLDLAKNFQSQSDRSCSVLFACIETCIKDLDSLPEALSSANFHPLISILSMIASDSSLEKITAEFEKLPESPQAQNQKALEKELEAMQIKPSENLTHTTTFSTEVSQSNQKVIRLLEILKLLYRKFLSKSEQSPKATIFPKLPEALINQMKKHTNNNILHNHIFRLWTEVIDSENIQLFDLFFTNNQTFIRTLEEISLKSSDNLSNSKKTARPGFLGHLKSLCTYINKSKLSDRLSSIKEYSDFCQNFYLVEKEFESRLLGDVDVRPEETDGDVYFAFTIDEIRTKYFEFLGYQAEEGAGTPDTVNTESEEGNDIHDSGDAIIVSNQSEEPLQEMKNLDVMTIPEEVAYYDHNYWKPNIDFDIDSLVNELNIKK